jgi:hypothetical protein
MMKKVVGMVLAVTLAASVLAPMSAQAANTDKAPGGVPAFFIGCCFGLRVGTQWNEGVDLHWREWASVIPGFNIWNGVDCANGITGHEFAEMYGASWY